MVFSELVFGSLDGVMKYGIQKEPSLLQRC
jgi:hypothetical protein